MEEPVRFTIKIDMSKINLQQVKAALKDRKFREMLPLSLEQELNSFLKDPGCTCNIKFIKKIIKNHKKELLKYYPNSKIENDEKELLSSVEYKWKVLNSNIYDISNDINKIRNHVVSIKSSRYEDKLTLILKKSNIKVKNNWKIINCKIKEINDNIINLKGNINIDVSIYKDEATIIINDVELG